MGGRGDLQPNYRDNRTSEKSSRAETKEPQQATKASKVHHLRGAVKEDPPRSADSATTCNTGDVPRKNCYLTAKNMNIRFMWEVQQGSLYSIQQAETLRTHTVVLK